MNVESVGVSAHPPKVVWRQGFFLTSGPPLARAVSGITLARWQGITRGCGFD